MTEPRRSWHLSSRLALAFTVTLVLAAGTLSSGCAKPPVAEVDQDVPTADTDTRPPTTPAATKPATMSEFLTLVLGMVDGYWRDTLSSAGLPEPSVTPVWVAPGHRVQTACEEVADENAAYYCPADDRIYIGQRFAYDLWAGVNDDLPGVGRAYGDFAVAFTLAHEYGHNLQHELGLFEAHPDVPTKQFELQADCFAGVWANSAYYEGWLEAGDTEEALATAMAVGDFVPEANDSHGLPTERRDAWLAGYNSGSPETCMQYVPGAQAV
jgi:predicted metalloprotease